MMADLHDHETRIAILEKDCDRYQDKFSTMFEKLDEIQESIHEIKIQNAKASGFKAALWGGGAGGFVWGLGKMLAVFTTKP